MIGPADGVREPSSGARRTGDRLFLLGGPDDARRIATGLSGIVAVRPRESTRAKRLFVDTADARLAGQGMRLSVTREGRSHVLSFHAPETTARVLRLGAVPAFETDLPPGPFRSALADVIGE